MAYDCVIREPVLYASWKSLSEADLREITKRLESMRVRTGVAAVYVARIPGDGRIFTSEESAAMLAFLNVILGSCSTVHHVIEGDGFMKSARLATVTTMALQTPRPRDFYVYEDLARAIEAVRAMHGVDLSQVVNRAAPNEDDSRASSAFRAAARLFDPRTKK